MGLKEGLAGNRIIRSVLSKGMTDSLVDLLIETKFRVSRILRKLSPRQRKALRELDAAEVRKLHLGCGPNILPGWLNADIDYPQADILLDLREKFPFPNDYFDFVYSEAVIEHLQYLGETKLFLDETLRVLKPGGAVSVVAPDGVKCFYKLMDKDPGLFPHPQRSRFFVGTQVDSRRI